MFSEEICFLRRYLPSPVSLPAFFLLPFFSGRLEPNKDHGAYLLTTCRNICTSSGSVKDGPGRLARFLIKSSRLPPTDKKEKSWTQKIPPILVIRSEYCQWVGTTVGTYGGGAVGHYQGIENWWHKFAVTVQYIHRPPTHPLTRSLTALGR